MTSVTDVQNAFRILKDKFGGANVVINCAGIGIAVRTLSKNGPHPLEDFQRVLKVNTVGTFNVIRIGAEQMSTGPALNKSNERGEPVYGLFCGRGTM